MTVYRKRGRVVRYENGTVVRVDEAGEAREIGGEFWAEPALLRARGENEELGADECEAAVRDGSRSALALTGQYGVRLERIVVSEGIVEHELGAHRWRERFRRIHLSLARGSHRALLDLSGFDEEIVAEVARGLASLQGERVLTGVQLAPNVTAALLPGLAGSVDLEQMPADHDGYGEPIARRSVVVAAAPPNWYRPSYRIRPVRAWHNVRAVPFGALDHAAPRALALLAPPEKGMLRVLCRDGESAFAATVAVTSIRAVGEAVRWYPYAAGTCGAEMLL
jgi:hypothetical protein